MSDEPQLIAINDSLWIPRAELTFRATRSGGPGGQHVNTSSTRVELAWDLAGSPSVTEEQRARLREKLANRVNAEGVLLLASSEHRSQHQNREAAVERFAALLRQALVVPRPRKQTRPPRAVKEARLRAKKRRAETKRLRGSVPDDE
ncbi:MAG TPA: alternative ribosome rescue aminoacyl-tRNA hydrolase ArfB [Longimicrobiaceae bacterium]|nr:alternative ribosome rescue aminoacyl-tRNA hydrolase ArfB [Longimicrobiaceae bacterium]